MILEQAGPKETYRNPNDIWTKKDKNNHEEINPQSLAVSRIFLRNNRC
jgi:hypothetical protein